MPDINHPVRHALAALGVGDDPAVRSLYYRWAGFMADVRWERTSVWGQDAPAMRRELLAYFNDDRVEMKRQMEILRGHVFAAIDHAKVQGAAKRAEEHRLTLERIQDDERPYPPEHLARVAAEPPQGWQNWGNGSTEQMTVEYDISDEQAVFLSHDEAVARYRK